MSYNYGFFLPSSHGIFGPIFQRQLILQTYKRRYEHEDLVDTLKKELHDDSAKELILALLYNPEVYDAVSLHKAMKVSRLILQKLYKVYTFNYS